MAPFLQANVHIVTVRSECRHLRRARVVARLHVVKDEIWVTTDGCLHLTARQEFVALVIPHDASDMAIKSSCATDRAMVVLSQLSDRTSKSMTSRPCMMTMSPVVCVADEERYVPRPIILCWYWMLC